MTNQNNVSLDFTPEINLFRYSRIESVALVQKEVDGEDGAYDDNREYKIEPGGKNSG
jgi:hypothetical protein